jgi:hypothetical protein
MSHMANPAAMAVLTLEPLVREVLKQVAASRLIGFRDLAKRTEGQVDRDQLKAALDKLETLQLVDVRPAAIEELEKILITADGLSAARRVGR